MAVQCGWAAIDERGRASGGRAGDQTGWEVHLGPWYRFGQTEVFRWKDRAKAKQYAEIIRYWCSGNYVGYDQSQRTTLGAWCKAHKWSYKVNQYVETDCSRMVADGINCTMRQEIIAVGSVFYTGNMRQRLMATGLFTHIVGPNYCSTPDWLMEGDIINNPASHVISALENGKNAQPAKKVKKPIATIVQEIKAGKWGVDPIRKAKLKAAGYSDAELTEIYAKVTASMGKKAALKTARVVATKGLNVRNKPTTTGSKILRTLPYTAKVTCYGTAKGPGATLWWKISPNKAEFVSADWLK